MNCRRCIWPRTIACPVAANDTGDFQQDNRLTSAVAALRDAAGRPAASSMPAGAAQVLKQT